MKKNKNKTVGGSGGSSVVKADWRSVFSKKPVGVEDMTLLSSISNKDIQSNLEKRFFSGEIYTYIGHVLISVNPYRDLGIYSDEYVQRYVGRSHIEVPPHIFAIAETSYRNMISYDQDQCIIISGESGAGKTEAAKKILHYLSAVSNSSSSAVSEVKSRVLASNPVLESFGNAKTQRNNNSSRFGKYLQILFDDKNEPIGAITRNYLLEKSRVVHQTRGERNYHILYQLCAGASEAERQAYCIYSAQDYFYTNQGGNCIIDGVNDAEDFYETRSAMTTLGIGDHAQQEIVRVLASILWLGNLTFEETRDGSKVSSREVLEMIAYLLEVNQQTLEAAMVTRYMDTGSELKRGSMYMIPLNVTQATAARDSLSKALYDRLFNRIVESVNDALKPNTSACSQSIGILDIYGFEIFEKNSFEQLCINYVNEKLQQIFVELTLKSEQEEYVMEGIKWTPIEYFDNKIVCDLIESKRPPGIFSVLNDVVATAHADNFDADKSFVQRLACCANNRHFKPMGKAFCVRHYAGDVTYEAYEMPVKNKDNLNYDMQMLIKSSQFHFLTTALFQADDLSTGEGRKKMPTVADRIKLSAGDLVQALMKTQPSYVRCIKPNELKSSRDFNHERTIQQIKYLDLLANVRVRRAGFCHRQPFDDFLQHFFLLSPKTSYAGELIYRGDSITGCKYILKDAFISPDEFQFGKTKVFIRHPETLWALEHLRDKYWHHMATRIQRSYRSHVRRKHEAASVIQKWWRLWQLERPFVALRDSSHLLYQRSKERRRFSLLSIRRFTVGDYLNVKQSSEICRLINCAPAKILLSSDCQVLVDRFLRSPLLVQKQFILSFNAVYLISKDRKTQELILERQIPVYQLRKISTSPFADDWIVLHYGEHDLAFASPFKTEICARIIQQIGSKICVDVASELEFNNRPKKLRSLKFQKSIEVPRESVTLQKGKFVVGPGDDPSSTTLQPRRKQKQFKKVKPPSTQPQFNSRKHINQRAALHQKKYKAIFAYDAQRGDELTFGVGQEFFLLENDGSGWLKVKNGSNEGWIPENYVEECLPSPPVSPALPPPTPASSPVFSPPSGPPPVLFPTPQKMVVVKPRTSSNLPPPSDAIVNVSNAKPVVSANKPTSFVKPPVPLAVKPASLGNKPINGGGIGAIKPPPPITSNKPPVPVAMKPQKLTATMKPPPPIPASKPPIPAAMKTTTSSYTSISALPKQPPVHTTNKSFNPTNNIPPPPPTSNKPHSPTPGGSVKDRINQFKSLPQMGQYAPPGHFNKR